MGFFCCLGKILLVGAQALAIALAIFGSVQYVSGTSAPVMTNDGNPTSTVSEQTHYTSIGYTEGVCQCGSFKTADFYPYLPCMAMGEPFNDVCWYPVNAQSGYAVFIGLVVALNVLLPKPADISSTVLRVARELVPVSAVGLLGMMAYQAMLVSTQYMPYLNLCPAGQGYLDNGYVLGYAFYLARVQSCALIAAVLLCLFLLWARPSALNAVLIAVAAIGASTGAFISESQHWLQYTATTPNPFDYHGSDQGLFMTCNCRPFNCAAEAGHFRTQAVLMYASYVIGAIWPILAIRDLWLFKRAGVASAVSGAVAVILPAILFVRFYAWMYGGHCEAEHTLMDAQRIGWSVYLMGTQGAVTITKGYVLHMVTSFLIARSASREEKKKLE